MEPSGIEICVGSFCPDGHHFRLLDASEAAAVLERIDLNRLRERGIVLDPFDLRPFGQRTRYEAVEAEELPADFDPWDVGELVVPEEETIPWSETDRAAAARFAKSSRPRLLSFEELHDPFRVTVTS